MNFAQTSFLIALAALAIPVFVHLLSRWQVRRVELGTMRFLQEVIQEAAARRRVRRWLLLSTRASLLTFLALLFARPFFSELGPRDGDRMRIVLVDRSASMSMQGAAGRLIDDAIAAAEASLSDLGEDARIIWAWFDRDVEAIAESQQSRPIAPTVLTGDTDYWSALRWARDRVQRESKARCDVVLITDLQQAGLAAVGPDAGPLDFPSDVPVDVIDVGRPAAGNLAITNLATLSARLPPERPVRVEATLFNYGSLPMEEIAISATASCGDRTRRIKKTINVPNDQAQEVSFDFGALHVGVWLITVDADVNDDLAIDNRRRVAVSIADPYPLLILDPGTEGLPRTQASFYLRTALEQSRAVDSSLVQFDVSVDYLKGSAMGKLNSRDEMIVVADASGILPARVTQLAGHVRAGASLLVFAGSTLPPATSAAFVQSGLSPGKLQSQTRAGVAPFHINMVHNTSSMLKPFHDPQHGDLGKLRFATVLRAEPDPSTEVHAWFDKRHPAITEHLLGNGRVVWFLAGVSAGGLDNWTTSPLFLPVVQQMVSELLGLHDEGPVRMRSVGDLSLASVAEASTTAQRFETPGFFSDAGVTYVVNTPAKESDPARVQLEDFFNHYQLTPFHKDTGAPAGQVESEQRNEIWPWLASVVLILLVAEFGLANRTPA